MTDIGLQINGAPLVAVTASIVSAYLSGNRVTPGGVIALIEDVHASLLKTVKEEAPREVQLVPAVPINRSVFNEYIICLEDGKKFKSLKRHLRASFGLTPEQYRKKWGLPHDYPMVAPNYSVARSRLARQTGLGRSAGAAWRKNTDVVHNAAE